jgi:hypothetical protein
MRAGRIFWAWLWLLHLAVIVMPSIAQSVIQDNTSSLSAIRAPRLGVTFINSADIHADDVRYGKALDLGAGWNRYPVYWNQIEVAPTQYEWERYDRLVIDDTRHQLQANAILLGIPPFHRDGEVPIGINEPVFADGNDFPKNPDSTLNPANPWVNFVYQAVQRYKPNGILAQAQGWQNGEGVRVWEIWNEPDLKQFWGGSVGAYARLLKTAYITIKHADPSAKVMFGGLLYNSDDNWLARTLAIFVNDPFGEQNKYYFDQVAVHSYSYPWRSGWLVLYARETLDAYKLKKDIWLNESGVSVWDDYPGPTWAKTAEERQNMATADQQAWYFIQSSVYAWSEGADVVFFHQLYDDCGDQPAGTNFPPHNGDLCFNGQICWGNAFGLFRNESNAICFSQSPQGGFARPVVNAYQLVARVFGTQEFVTDGTVQRQDDGTASVSFVRPNTQERITVVWNRMFEPVTTRLPALGTNAQLLTLYSNTLITPDAEGNFVLNLSSAQPDAYPFLEADDQSAIGGAPIILIQKPDGTMGAFSSAIIPNNPNVSAPVAPLAFPTTVLLPTQNATSAPDGDTIPPIPRMNGLPITSPSVFMVSWGADDNGQVVKYLVWVRIDGGEWQPWLETAQTQAEYVGESGKRYDFAVWAQDAAGNWSSNTDLQSMASTQVQ